MYLSWRNGYSSMCLFQGLRWVIRWRKTACWWWSRRSRVSRSSRSQYKTLPNRTTFYCFCRRTTTGDSPGRLRYDLQWNKGLFFCESFLRDQRRKCNNRSNTVRLITMWGESALFIFKLCSDLKTTGSSFWLLFCVWEIERCLESLKHVHNADQ